MQARAANTIFLNASWSWEQLLKSHLRKPDQPKTAINVVYGPGNGKDDLYAQVSQRMHTPPGHGPEPVGPLCLARTGLDLEMQQTCGAARMRAGISRSRKVIVCYELADEFSELYNLYGRTMAFSLDPEVPVAAKTGRESVAVRKQKSLRAKRVVR